MYRFDREIYFLILFLFSHDLCLEFLPICLVNANGFSLEHVAVESLIFHKSKTLFILWYKFQYDFILFNSLGQMGINIKLLLCSTR